LDKKLLAPCGLYCGFCPNLKKETTPYCSGCRSKEGHPFWGECGLYSCAAEQKVENCGLCKDFPCDLFVGHFEGAPDNIEGQKDAIYRLGLLAYLRKFGTEKCLEMVKKLSH